MDNHFSFDGLSSYPIATPTSVAEIGELVRRAGESGQALYPFGGRTMMDIGHLPMKPGTAVDLRALNQVIDYPAAI